MERRRDIPIHSTLSYDPKGLGAWGAYLRSKSRAWLAKPDLSKSPTKTASLRSPRPLIVMLARRFCEEDSGGGGDVKGIDFTVHGD